MLTLVLLTISGVCFIVLYVLTLTWAILRATGVNISLLGVAKEFIKLLKEKK